MNRLLILLLLIFSLINIIKSEENIIDVNGNIDNNKIESVSDIIISNDKTKLINYLSNRNNNINEVSDIPLLVLAAAHKFNEGIELLLQNKVNVNSVEGDNWSALTFCAANGNMECVKILIKYNVNPFLRSKRGNLIAYDYAKLNNYHEVNYYLFINYFCFDYSNIVLNKIILINKCIYI